MEEKYRKVELQGKHGKINLMIPDRDPTQEEIESLHTTIAEVIVDEYKIAKKRKASSE